MSVPVAAGSDGSWSVAPSDPAAVSRAQRTSARGPERPRSPETVYSPAASVRRPNDTADGGSAAETLTVNDRDSLSSRLSDTTTSAS